MLFGKEHVVQLLFGGCWGVGQLFLLLSQTRRFSQIRSLANPLLFTSSTDEWSVRMYDGCLTGVTLDANLFIGFGLRKNVALYQLSGASIRPVWLQLRNNFDFGTRISGKGRWWRYNAEMVSAVLSTVNLPVEPTVFITSWANGSSDWASPCLSVL